MAIATNLADLEKAKFKESTVTANQAGVVVVNPDGSNVGASVTVTADTEFPAAAALAENVATPTTTKVGSMNYVYDGTTWDFQRGTAEGGTYVQGPQAHDAAIANQNPVLQGARAIDPTSLPSAVAAGDLSYVGVSLQQELLTYKSRLDSGEDQTNLVYAVVEKPLAVSTYAPDLDTSAALEASSVTKASAGVLYGVTFSNTNAATRYLQFFNSTTVPADTTVPVIEIAVAAESTVSVEWPKGRAFSTGIAWCNSSTNGAKTVGSADSLADVSYK